MSDNVTYLLLGYFTYT